MMTAIPSIEKNTPPKNRGWILLALMLFMMLAAMDVTIISTAIPQIAADLGHFSLFTWVFSIYLLAQTVTIPIYGKLADLYGRKPILLFGSAVFLIASILAAVAWSMPSLIIARAIQGLGAGAMVATINTLAGDLYTVRERAKIQGLLSSVWGIAAITGPLLGGAFAEYVSWRWIFLINLPIGILAMGLLSFCLKEHIIKKRHSIDYLSSLYILLAVTTLMLGLLEGGQSWRWVSIESLAALLFTLLFSLLAIRSQQKAAEPILPGWLWQRPALVGANLSMIGMGFMVMGPIAYLPVFAQSVYQLNAIWAGLILAAMSISWPLASSLSGQLYLKIGFRNTALCGSLITLIAAILFLCLPFQAPIWAVTLVPIIIGAGFGLMSTSTLVGAQSSVGWSQRGVVTGANMFARFLGQSVGVACFGAIFNAKIMQQLQMPSQKITSQVPQSLDAMINLLQDTHAAIANPLTAHFLREVIFNATYALFIALFLVGLATLFIIIKSPKVFSSPSPKQAREHSPAA